MAEKRLRKRSTRQAEPDLEPFEDPPPKKRSRKQPNPPAAGAKSRKKQKNGAVSNSSSPASSVTAGRQTRGGKRGKRLLVSLNLQDNDLHVPGQAGVEAGVARRPASGRGGPGKGRGRPATQQERDQSVGSDGSSSNGSGGSGRPMAFKNPNFKFSAAGPSKKKVWKNLKQMLVMEKSLGVDPYTPTYASIDAPPSFKPAKKYSDLSGLAAKYTDPLTGMYFSSAEEFKVLRALPQDVIQGYLALRGKLTIM